jgi:hypothetical protein
MPFRLLRKAVELENPRLEINFEYLIARALSNGDFKVRGKFSLDSAVANANPAGPEEWASRFCRKVEHTWYALLDEAYVGPAPIGTVAWRESDLGTTS